MSKRMQAEYDTLDEEDRGVRGVEVEEQEYNEDQDCQDDDHYENQAQDYQEDDDDWEAREDREDLAAKFATEIEQEDLQTNQQAQLETEQPILLRASVAQPKEENHEQKAYEEFMALCARDKALTKAKEELMAYPKKFQGSLVAQINAMVADKEAVTKEGELKEAEQRKAEVERRIKAVTQAGRVAGKKRSQEKENKPNAKGGVVAKTLAKAKAEATVAPTQTGQGRQAQRKLVVQTKLVVVQPNRPIVQLAPLEQLGNIKAKGRAAESVLIQAEEIETEEVEEPQERVVLPEVSQIDIPQEPKASQPKASQNEWVTVPSNVRAPKIQLGFKGLIQQHKEDQGRTQGHFEQKDPASLSFTKLCISVTTSGTGKCQHGSKCRFAHTLEQLNHQNCRFGKGCLLVVSTAEGVYKNKPSSRTGKTCQCWHQGETQASYGARMGFKVNTPVSKPQAPVAEPVKLELKKAEFKLAVVPAKSAPWAGIKTAPQVATERKTRWGPEKDDKASKGVPAQAPERKTRWGAEKTQVVEQVIQVPKSMVAQMELMVKSQGVKCRVIGV